MCSELELRVKTVEFGLWAMSLGLESSFRAANWLAYEHSVELKSV